MHFMLNRQGVTLVETLLAFSIFVSCIVVILSCYNVTLSHVYQNEQNYLKYLEKQMDKEGQLWNSSELSESILEVLP